MRNLQVQLQTLSTRTPSSQLIWSTHEPSTGASPSIVITERDEKIDSAWEVIDDDADVVEALRGGSEGMDGLWSIECLVQIAGRRRSVVLPSVVRSSSLHNATAIMRI